MTKIIKSFEELGDIYMNSVVLNESEKPKTGDDLGAKKAGMAKKTGPEAADGFKKKLEEKKKVPAKKVVDESDETEDEPTVKESNVKQNMQTKKSSFDELYERAMNEGPDSVVSPVVDDMASPDGSAPTDDATPFGADAPAEVDPTALFAQVCDLLNQLKAHYGIEEPGEEGAEGEMGAGEVNDIEDMPPTQESVETQELPNSKGASLQGKKNDVGAVKVVKGKADNGKLESDPEPKPLGDKKAALQGKNNKVAGSGAQSKVGASVFES